MQIYKDLVEMTRAAGRPATAKNLLWAAALDSFPVLALTRVRETARRLHLGGLNRVLRLVTQTIYGIEIGKNVSLGDGVYFVHTLGTVIGGDARIGSRVRFMGSNTIGTARDDGYPIIEDDVVIGAGARVLGKVHVGKGAVIGANAVVLTDIPPGATAVGAPARAVKSTGGVKSK